MDYILLTERLFATNTTRIILTVLLSVSELFVLIFFGRPAQYVDCIRSLSCDKSVSKKLSSTFYTKIQEALCALCICLVLFIFAVVLVL